MGPTERCEEVEQSLIEVSNLVQIYNGQAVVDVDHLAINQGDVVALLGRNGSGKSTLLRMLCLLERPASGDVLFRGRRLASDRERLDQRRRMAMVFQEPLLFSGTVAYNVSYALSIRRLPRDEISSRCKRALSLLGIEHLAGRDVDTLSGGEAQRVSLARALAIEPEILFLDEPMANLDNPTRVAFRRDLARVLKELRSTAVYVTHEVTEALCLGNRIAVMRGGRIVQDAEPAEVWNRPASEEVASLVGIENLIPGVVVGPAGQYTCVRCGETEVLSDARVPAGREVKICVRPDHVLVDLPSCSREMEGRDNHLPGVVSSVEPLGPVTSVTVDCGFPIVAHVAWQPAPGIDLHPGARVYVRFSPGNVHLLQSLNESAIQKNVMVGM